MMDCEVLKRVEDSSCKKYLSMLLMSYGADENFLDVIVELCHSDIDDLLIKMRDSCRCGVVIAKPKATFLQDFSDFNVVMQ